MAVYLKSGTRDSRYAWSMRWALMIAVSMGCSSVPPAVPVAPAAEERPQPGERRTLRAVDRGPHGLHVLYSLNHRGAYLVRVESEDGAWENRIQSRSLDQVLSGFAAAPDGGTVLAFQETFTVRPHPLLCGMGTKEYEYAPACRIVRLTALGVRGNEHLEIGGLCDELRVTTVAVEYRLQPWAQTTGPWVRDREANPLPVQVKLHPFSLAVVERDPQPLHPLPWDGDPRGPPDIFGSPTVQLRR